MILAYPAFAAKPLERGVQAPSLPEPFVLRAEDFSDETHARIFALLQEHTGEDLGTVLSDERARNLMDRLVALGAKAEEMSQKDLYSSEASVRMTWLRLGILSRESSKRQTQDLEEKETLQTEIQALKEALRAVSVEP